MAVNKVIVNNETKLDLTGDSVTPDTLLEGVTAHDASGTPITGTAKSTPAGAILMIREDAGTNIYNLDGEQLTPAEAWAIIKSFVEKYGIEALGTKSIEFLSADNSVWYIPVVSAYFDKGYVIARGDGSAVEKYGRCTVEIAVTETRVTVKYSAIASPSNLTPLMDGTASAGSYDVYARGDHRHPTDTSRQEKITASGLLKGDGSGGVSAAVAGTDYVKPSALSEKQDKLTGTAGQVVGFDADGNAVAQAAPAGVEAATAAPLANGTAAVGTSAKYAREDHVHPTDTTRQTKLTGTKGQIVGFDESGAAAAQDDKAVMLEKVQATLPSSASWLSVTYGNGKFVAVAYNSNKAAYSTDGITWTAATLPSSANWLSVTYGNGKFVTVAYNSSNKAAYSTDGINWTAATLPSDRYWYSVTYSSGKFVAVAGDSNKAAYSTDGITWTAATMPSSASWYAVTYGNGKFVAVAYNSNKAAYSTDGITWTAATMPSSANWQSVTYGNGKFVAIARNNSNKAAYSTDGINWTAATMPSSANWYSVTYGNGKFVAVAYNKAAYSTDGITWTAATMPSSASWYAVTYGNGKFVAVAGTFYGDSNKAAYSTNGITWQDSGPYLSDSTDEDITDTVAELIQPKLDLSGKLDKSGGTMTGNVKFNDNANLFFGNEAEGMFYVDSSVLILLCEYGLKIDAHVLRLISNEATLNNQPIAVKPKATLVTLAASGWTYNTQTVTVSGVLADETKQLIQVMPASASAAAYYGAGVYGSGQAANKLTFTCDSVPTADLSVYVTVQDVNYS